MSVPYLGETSPLESANLTYGGIFNLCGQAAITEASTQEDALEIITRTRILMSVACSALEPYEAKMYTDRIVKGVLFAPIAIKAALLTIDELTDHSGLNLPVSQADEFA